MGYPSLAIILNHVKQTGERKKKKKNLDIKSILLRLDMLGFRDLVWLLVWLERDLKEWHRLMGNGPPKRRIWVWFMVWVFEAVDIHGVSVGCSAWGYPLQGTVTSWFWVTTTGCKETVIYEQMWTWENRDSKIEAGEGTAQLMEPTETPKMPRQNMRRRATFSQIEWVKAWFRCMKTISQTKAPKQD